MTTENTNLPADQNPPQDAPGEDSEFDAAMDEAAAEEGAPASAAADPDSGASFDGTDEPPAPATPAAADAPPAEGSDASPSGNPTDSDIWANAPAEYRQAFEQMKRDAELRLKSVQGRQSAADRELQRLRQERAELEQRLQSQPTGEQDNSGEQQQTEDPYAQLVEDYPEIAGPLVEQLRAVQAKLGEVEKVAGTFQQERELTFYKQQQDILTEQQPDWQTALGDERFGGWLSEQPLPVQQAFERNASKIVDGREAAWLVGQFKTALGIGQSQQTGQPQANRRAKQLASGRDYGRGGGGPVTDAIPDDFDAALNAYADQADARAHRR